MDISFVNKSECKTKIVSVYLKRSVMTWQKYLETNYFKPEHPSAFGGPSKVQQILKKDGGYDVTYEQVRNWLQNQDAYSLHKPVRYKFKRNRVISQGIDYLWDMDLADVTNITDHNNGIKFLLILIDVFSKHLWVEPLKDKKHDTIIAALKAVFNKTNRRPIMLRSDRGSEFVNRWVSRFLKLENIKHYTTRNETKANFAERVIRTLKAKMYRYFTHYETYTYDNILQDLVSNYNHSPHSTLNGLSPNDINKENEAQIWKNMYVDSLKPSKQGLKSKRYRFTTGDKVRISYLKYPFQRDYQHKYSEEVFKINKRFKREGIPLYTLVDYDNDPIDGTFYENELQKVNKNMNDAWKIEKVLKRRIRNRKTELFVKWRGWPKKFNSWIPETNAHPI